MLGVPSHAGGVVYKVHEGMVLYLLVRPKNGANEWVLPQGHIEKGEDHAQAALREVEEETGVIAAVLGFVHRVQFQKQGAMQDTKFYLMRKIRQIAPAQRDERRETKWASLDQALDALSYQESKDAVIAADVRRKALRLP